MKAAFLALMLFAMILNIAAFPAPACGKGIGKAYLNNGVGYQTVFFNLTMFDGEDFLLCCLGFVTGFTFRNTTLQQWLGFSFPRGVHSSIQLLKRDIVWDVFVWVLWPLQHYLLPPKLVPGVSVDLHRCGHLRVMETIQQRDGWCDGITCCAVWHEREGDCAENRNGLRYSIRVWLQKELPSPHQHVKLRWRQRDLHIHSRSRWQGDSDRSDHFWGSPPNQSIYLQQRWRFGFLCVVRRRIRRYQDRLYLWWTGTVQSIDHFWETLN